jgi:hypothetical protein
MLMLKGRSPRARGLPTSHTMPAKARRHRAMPIAVAAARAIVDASRLVRTATMMSETEAEAFGLSSAERDRLKRAGRRASSSLATKARGLEMCHQVTTGDCEMNCRRSSGRERRAKSGVERRCHSSLRSVT